MRTGILFCTTVAATWLLPAVSSGEESAPLFPFVISYDGPDNASSMAHLLDAPAGKHGFIRTEGRPVRYGRRSDPAERHEPDRSGELPQP